jgi:hypothetical protein
MENNPFHANMPAAGGINYMPGTRSAGHTTKIHISYQEAHNEMRGFSSGSTAAHLRRDGVACSTARLLGMPERRRVSNWVQRITEFGGGVSDNQSKHLRLFSEMNLATRLWFTDPRMGTYFYPLL